MRLEGDEGRLAAGFLCTSNGMSNDIEVSEVHAVVAADCQCDGPDWNCREAEVRLQLRTFSGTKVRRSGSV